jgi:hypothetical protein
MSTAECTPHCELYPCSHGQELDVQTMAIRPLEPAFFFEIDDTDIKIFQRIKSILKDIQIAYSLESQIYETKHGYHLVVELEHWEQVTFLRKTFFSWIEVNYFNNDPTKAALRVTAKRSIKTGKVISPAPRLVWESKKGLKDLRKPKKYHVEIYKTVD